RGDREEGLVRPADLRGADGGNGTLLEPGAAPEPQGPGRTDRPALGLLHLLDSWSRRRGEAAESEVLRSCGPAEAELGDPGGLPHRRHRRSAEGIRTARGRLLR